VINNVLWTQKVKTQQENKQKCQTDTKYARRICGKFNGNNNILGYST